MEIIQPYIPQKNFPHHQGTVQLFGWFVKNNLIKFNRLSNFLNFVYLYNNENYFI